MAIVGEEKKESMCKEQGGDQIIFLSLIQEVKEMCGTLSVYVDPRLENLCRRAMPEINFVKDIEQLEEVECDCHCRYSLGRLIRNDIGDFDRTFEDIQGRPERVEAMHSELKLNGKKAIGISWKSFKISKILKKSIQLKDMECIFSGLDVVR